MGHNWDGIGDDCGYEDLGGASNIVVDPYGYCARRDTSQVCCEIGWCAEQSSIVPSSNVTLSNAQCSTDYSTTFASNFCSSDLLDEVAFYNYFWLNAVLVVKCVGLCFLLLLEVRACLNAVDSEAEEAQQADTCLKCKQWGKACCCSTFVLVLKGAFLLFGTFATFAALYYMQLTGQVWTSTCSALPSALRAGCEATESECNDGDNFYAVAFDALELGGPYYADVVSNVLHSVLWVVRIAVMRYAIKSTHLTSV